MAVHVLPHSLSRFVDQAPSLPAPVLALTLAPTALDLMKLVQPSSVPYIAAPAIVLSAAASAVLLLMWLRFPRTSWLAGATLGAGAGAALRMTGADVAPLLSLLAIVAVGVGGGFASPEVRPAGA